MTMPTNHELKPLSPRQLAALTAGLNPARIASRKGTGSSQLSYMEAWDIKATLIKVFGFGGFSADVTESKIEKVLTQAEHGGNAKWVVMCSATVRLHIHQLGATYTEVAVSSQAGSQIGEVADFAMKTAESDALKRCAIYLGTQFGLSLYNDGSIIDVVKIVLAEGQEWPALNPQEKAFKALADHREAEYIKAVVEGIDPETAKAEIYGTPEDTPHAVRKPADPSGPPEGSAQTPEQYAATQALIQRGLTMRAQQAAQGADMNAAAAEDAGTAAVLEPDYSAEEEAYAAADGHHD